jgi:two-component system LytT family response regulator
MRRLLKAHPDVEIVGEGANVGEALALIEQTQPQLIFLDIKMPGQTGFDLLHELDRAPQVIFTTAHDEFAIRAFEVNALDYLLKPVEPDRLSIALERVRARVPQGVGETASKYLTAEDRIFVRDGEKYWFVPLGEISLFESEGNYTRLHIGDDTPLVHRSLNYLDQRLDPQFFFRANRQQIINLGYISSLDRGLQSGLLVRMKDGQNVEMSRRRAQEFRERTSL